MSSSATESAGYAAAARRVAEDVVSRSELYEAVGIVRGWRRWW